MPHKVFIFGEMLWDCLPSGSKAGGAPLNVALNLHQLGLNSNFISAIGNDLDGEKLVEYIKSYGISDKFIQRKDAYQTSKVLVDNSDPENIKYTILPNVAWDHISITDELIQASQNCDAFIFGTLGVRSNESLKTLLALLPKQKLRIFDANLRSPFYDFEVIETLLGYTEILKINEDELEIFADYFNTEATVESLCEFLDHNFPIEIICITLGSKGAMIYQNGQITQHPGYKIKVKDSIGAGDAFLSGFVKTYLDGKDPEEILDFACKIGAFVATQEGGTPKYQVSDINQIH